MEMELLRSNRESLKLPEGKEIFCKNVWQDVFAIWDSKKIWYFVDGKNQVIFNTNFRKISSYQQHLKFLGVEEKIDSKGDITLWTKKGKIDYFSNEYYVLCQQIRFLNDRSVILSDLQNVNEEVDEDSISHSLKTWWITLVDMIRFGDRIRTSKWDWYKKYYQQALAKLPEQCMDSRYDIKEEDIKFLYQARVDGGEIISKELAAKCIQIIRKRLSEQQSLKQKHTQIELKWKADTHTKLAALSGNISEAYNFPNSGQVMMQTTYRVDNTLKV